jgi:hypothetical protein
LSYNHVSRILTPPCYDGRISKVTISTGDIAMPQSRQDDLWDALATFAETTFIYLVLVALKRRLTEDEVWLLSRATKVAEQLVA